MNDQEDGSGRTAGTTIPIPGGGSSPARAANLGPSPPPLRDIPVVERMGGSRLRTRCVPMRISALRALMARLLDAAVKLGVVPVP